MITYYTNPQLINLELTDMCPINCPQCYCTLNEGKFLSYEIAEKIINESEQLSVQYINLSGGETLLYPKLNSLIKLCSDKKLISNIAISGFNFNQKIYSSLMSSGLTGFFVSLNGSTETINSYSRNGFTLGMSALQLLSQNKNNNIYINWVMQNNNTLDFPNIVRLAETYRCKALVIIGMKPTSSNELINYPTLDDFHFIYKFIKRYSGPVQIMVENCFSQLKAFLSRNLFSNTNTGMLRGCSAGIDSISVNINGDFIPCRHINTPERYSTIKEYWSESKILQELRNKDIYSFNNCFNCTLKPFCKPCICSTYSTTEEKQYKCPLN